MIVAPCSFLACDLLVRLTLKLMVGQRLAKQLEDLEIPFTEDFPTAIKSTDHIVDAIFGLSS